MFLILADNIAGTAGAETGVAAGATPFFPDREVEAWITTDAVTGTAPEYKIQGSNDGGSTWDDLFTSVHLGTAVGTVKCMDLMRANVVTAGGTTAGTVSMFLRGGDD
jgi:hypothetical protein